MAGFVDSIEQAALDGLLRDPSWSGYATLYIGLSTTTPTDAGGNVTEPSTGSYARVSTTGTDWGPASGTAPALKSNTATKTFPAATEDWASGANFTHFTLHDAASAGNVVAFGALLTPKPVFSGDTASFGAGALVLKMGDTTDTY